MSHISVARSFSGMAYNLTLVGIGLLIAVIILGLRVVKEKEVKRV